MAHIENKELLEILHECMATCNHCFDACLQEENVKMMADCIRLDVECADICGQFAKALSRNSEFSKDYAELCAKICDACADECEKHEHDHCKKCAEVCRKCAEACRGF